MTGLLTFSELSLYILSFFSFLVVFSDELDLSGRVSFPCISAV